VNRDRAISTEYGAVFDPNEEAVRCVDPGVRKIVIPAVSVLEACMGLEPLNYGTIRNALQGVNQVLGLDRPTESQISTQRPGTLATLELLESSRKG